MEIPSDAQVRAIPVTFLCFLLAFSSVFPQFSLTLHLCGLMFCALIQGMTNVEWLTLAILKDGHYFCEQCLSYDAPSFKRCNYIRDPPGRDRDRDRQRETQRERQLFSDKMLVMYLSQTRRRSSRRSESSTGRRLRTSSQSSLPFATASGARDSSASFCVLYAFSLRSSVFSRFLVAFPAVLLAFADCLGRQAVHADQVQEGLRETDPAHQCREKAAGGRARRHALRREHDGARHRGVGRCDATNTYGRIVFLTEGLCRVAHF